MKYNFSDYGPLLKEIIEQNQILIEYTGEMRDQVREIPFIKTKITNLEQDVSIIKKIVTQNNVEIADHEVRMKN